MTDQTDQKEKKTLTLSGTLGLKKPADLSAMTSRKKGVMVEVKRRRGAAAPTASVQEESTEEQQVAPQAASQQPEFTPVVRADASQDRKKRLEAIKIALEQGAIEVGEHQAEALAEQERRRYEEQRRREQESKRQREEKTLKKLGEEEPIVPTLSETPVLPPIIDPMDDAKHRAKPVVARTVDEENEEEQRRNAHKKAVPLAVRKGEPARRDSARLTVQQALVYGSTEDSERDRQQRSVAALRRAREKKRHQMQQDQNSGQKIVREVVVPETITVQELANRMAERAADVVKSLMKMGVLATVNHAIDADTAELIVTEFGHTCKRVTEADVEIGMVEQTDAPEMLVSRPPVVTIMGHVDHGKTSLLDALRATDVVAHEAGGITQHIGAYQVTLASGQHITFIDTPGHAAFTEMRSRGANVTDIVVLVVAADDGIKAQTIEAIHHAKAANVPMILAINKIDKPGANADRVRQELLSQELVVESMGGDLLEVEVSAKQKKNLDKLEEAILLQAEILALKANPNRMADGVVIEAKLERGRGPVATVLVQRGTLRVGDIFVAGRSAGRVRGLVDSHGLQMKEAGPAMPIEVIGFDTTPEAGDHFVVMQDEARAREIVAYRERKVRESLVVKSRSSQDLTQLFANTEVRKELAVIIKADVQGSVEAIASSLVKLANDEVSVRILHAGVGAVTETDVSLAKASNALIVGFNVRANQQAKEMSMRDQVTLRYYSIIYNIIDDVKAMLTGLLSPVVREEFIGTVVVRQVFTITGSGRIAGCYVNEGVVKRGAKVRLLRDNVVIHEGMLKTLKRMKDEVKEVRQGYECGVAFENYQDIREGDVVECFEEITEKRELE